MREEIKQRIEAIGRGEVPDGYRRTRAGIMPLDWKDNVYAKDIFRNHTNKKHNGEFEVLSATQDRGIIPRSEVDIDIKYAEENIGSYKKVDSGDFVISLRSFQGGIEYSEYEGVVSPAYTILKANKPINDNFYRAYFKTPDFISRLNGAVYGIRDGKQIGFEDFGELAIHYPPIAEQKKIAEILSSCDRVIELKQQMLEEKRKQKHWLMQKLLDPDSGVRLPGFEQSEWIEVSLLDCCSKKGEYGLNASACEYVPELPRYIRITDIDDNGKYMKDAPVSVNVSDADEYYLHEGDLLFVRTGGTTGKVYRYETNDGLLVYAGFLIRFSVSLQGYDDFFIYSKFSTTGYANWVKVMSMRSGQPGINAEEYGGFKFWVPRDRAEQSAIATVLRCKDREIELLQKELQYWLQKKKALMQLLLTGLVRVKA